MSDQLLKEYRAGLEQIYGPRLVRLVLFGSQARGDAESGSDIDILVVLRGQVNSHEEITKTSSFAVALDLKYDVVVSAIYMSEDDFVHQRSPLLLNVRKEGVFV